MEPNICQFIESGIYQEEIPLLSENYFISRNNSIEIDPQKKQTHNGAGCLEFSNIIGNFQKGPQIMNNEKTISSIITLGKPNEKNYSFSLNSMHMGNTLNC